MIKNAFKSGKLALHTLSTSAKKTPHQPLLIKNNAQLTRQRRKNTEVFLKLVFKALCDGESEIPSRHWKLKRIQKSQLSKNKTVANDCELVQKLKCFF